MDKEGKSLFRFSFPEPKINYTNR